VSGLFRKCLVFKYLRFNEMAAVKKVSSVSRRANQREEGWPDRRESDETVQ
jgi:hypothetical protein